jgi:hypothetical protein
VRERDDFAYMLQAQLSTDLVLACHLLAERQTPPQGSTGTRWTLDAGRRTPDLFDPSGCSSSPSASTDMCSGEAEVCDVGR